MPISVLFVLLAFAAAAAVWAHQANLARYTVERARQHLQSQDLQFLDQSVVLQRLRLVRDRRQGWCLQRTYRFEFCSQGDRRYTGWITLTGRRMSGIELQPYHTAKAPDPLPQDPTLH